MTTLLKMLLPPPATALSLMAGSTGSESAPRDRLAHHLRGQLIDLITNSNPIGNEVSQLVDFHLQHEAALPKAAQDSHLASSFRPPFCDALKEELNQCFVHLCETSVSQLERFPDLHEGFEFLHSSILSLRQLFASVHSSFLAIVQRWLHASPQLRDAVQWHWQSLLHAVRAVLALSTRTAASGEASADNPEEDEAENSRIFQEVTLSDRAISDVEVALAGFNTVFDLAPNASISGFSSSVSSGSSFQGGMSIADATSQLSLPEFDVCETSLRRAIEPSRDSSLGNSTTFPTVTIMHRGTSPPLQWVLPTLSSQPFLALPLSVPRRPESDRPLDAASFFHTSGSVIDEAAALECGHCVCDLRIRV